MLGTLGGVRPCQLVWKDKRAEPTQRPGRPLNLLRIQRLLPCEDPLCREPGGEQQDGNDFVTRVHKSAVPADTTG
jgi:hypothetical protein